MARLQLIEATGLREDESADSGRREQRKLETNMVEAGAKCGASVGSVSVGK